MTVNSLIDEFGFEVICLPDGEREVDGCYIGDLLSWVMGRARENNAWITIMSNINVIAVAALSDVSCVILAEGVQLDEEVRKTAAQKGINVLCSQEPIFEIAVMLNGKV
jgi:predicted transcriptional regulator